MKSPEQKLRRKCTPALLSVRAKGVIFVVLCLYGLVQAEPLTLPADQRPSWLQRDGIVMAGPLLSAVEG